MEWWDTILVGLAKRIYIMKDILLVAAPLSLSFIIWYLWRGNKTLRGRFEHLEKPYIEEAESVIDNGFRELHAAIIHPPPEPELEKDEVTEGTDDGRERYPWRDLYSGMRDMDECEDRIDQRMRCMDNVVLLLSIVVFSAALAGGFYFVEGDTGNPAHHYWSAGTAAFSITMIAITLVRASRVIAIPIVKWVPRLLRSLWRRRAAAKTIREHTGDE